MEYLTNHDLFWVNQIVTGTVNTFNYFALEAACAGQYAYGASTDVPAQAATLLDRLLTKSPFLAGNRRTAYIAMLTFLNANGYAAIVDDEEAVRLMTAVAARNLPGLLEIALLQHLPIENAVRYAIATLSRYTLLIFGIAMTFNSVASKKV